MTDTPKFLRTAAIGCAFTLASPLNLHAELGIDIAPFGDAWVYELPHGEAPQDHLPFSTTPLWIVTCPGGDQRCFARGNQMILTYDAVQGPILRLSPEPTGHTALLIKDYAYDLQEVLGRPLTLAWQARLTKKAARIEIELEGAIAHSIALEGISLALSHLVSLEGVAPISKAPPPLRAMATAAEQAHESGPKLIPDTKPQIQFAIRAQRAPFPAPD